MQGSGKTAAVHKLSEIYPTYKAVEEGAYSPAELAWCAYMDIRTFGEMRDKYSGLRGQREKNTVCEGDRRVVCYTKIITDNREFYKDFEQYEIYNNRVSFEDFKAIVLSCFKAWDQDDMIFECALFQNIVEDMILFRCFSNHEITEFYRLIRNATAGKDYRILYLKTEDVKDSIEFIRKERSDDSGHELWFPMMIGYFNDSPYAKQKDRSKQSPADRDRYALESRKNTFPIK